jgi:phenylalanyl-tRNA synthetase alpha subunit
MPSDTPVNVKNSLNSVRLAVALTSKTRYTMPSYPYTAPSFSYNVVLLPCDHTVRQTGEANGPKLVQPPLRDRSREEVEGGLNPGTTQPAKQ